ncbi:vesicle-associated membrane protein 3 [Magallana gigas]|uniref:vesicle-associated membrane protein 3 n=1 Tax=Magallana gigas TaxID=29159 RepID=UPI003342CB76
MDEDTDEVQTGAHNLQQIQRQIHELVDVLDSNVQLLMNRHGNVEELEKLAEQLKEKAGEFQVITRRMKYKQVVRNNRWALSIGLVVLVVVLILAGVIISVVYNDRN